MRFTDIGLLILLQAAPLNPKKVSPPTDHAAQAQTEKQSTPTPSTAINVYQSDPNQTPSAKETAEENHKYERWGLWVSFISALATVALAIYSGQGYCLWLCGIIGYEDIFGLPTSKHETRFCLLYEIISPGEFAWRWAGPPEYSRCT